MITVNQNRKLATWIGGSVFTLGSVIAYWCCVVLVKLYEIKNQEGVIAAGMNRAMGWTWTVLLVTLVAALIGLGVAIWKTGSIEETDGTKTVKINGFDRIFSEVQILVGITVACFVIPAFELVQNCLYHSKWFTQGIVPSVTEQSGQALFGYYVEAPTGKGMYEQYPDLYISPLWVSYLLYILFMVVSLAICVLLLLSLVRKLKAHAFWKHSSLGLVVTYLMKQGKQTEIKLWKVILAILLIALLCATGIGAIVFVIAAIYFVPKWLVKYQTLKDGVDQVRQGNLTHQIPLTAEADGHIGQLAESINAISSAQDLAIQNELRTQKMRTELISNVSHDLRTPLTSMVSYLDLLEKEGLDGEHAEEYLVVIQEKTARLQKLTEDLFDAAKASSGDIPLNLEKIDMQSIVKQALAELDENLSQNNLQMVCNMNPDQHYFVHGDGRLLWRVSENLLTNVAKYAMPGTRVYVDLQEVEGSGLLAGKRIRLDVKNISKEPLNIDIDALMERFTRGDASRNTEGSGLGLSIARDLTQLMGGTFDLTVDGDLFKATVELPKLETPISLYETVDSKEPEIVCTPAEEQ